MKPIACLIFALLTYSELFAADLLIVTSENCPPCRQFHREYRQDSAFRTSLNNGFTLRMLRWEVPQEQQQIVQMGIERFPAFVVTRNGRCSRPIYGFVPTRGGKTQLLAMLGLSAVAVEPAPEAPVPPPEVDPPKGDLPWAAPTQPSPWTGPTQPIDCDEQLQLLKDALKALEDSTVRSQRSHETSVAAQLAAIQKTIAALGSSPGEMSVPQSLLDRLAAIEQRLSQVEESPRLANVEKQITAIAMSIQEIKMQVAKHQASHSTVPPVEGGSSWPADDKIRRQTAESVDFLPADTPSEPSEPPSQSGNPDDASRGPPVQEKPSFIRKAAGTAVEIAAPHVLIAAIGLATGGLAVPAGMMALRGLRRMRARRAAGQQSPASPHPPEQPESVVHSEYKIPKLPTQNIDYSTTWAEHWVASGLNPMHEAKKLGVYVDAVRAVESGDLKLPGVSSPKVFAQATRSWVNRLFVDKVGITPNMENFNHKAFFGFLHRRIVDNIRQGLFSSIAPDTSAADVLEDFVNQKIVSQLGV